MLITSTVVMMINIFYDSKAFILLHNFIVGIDNILFMIQRTIGCNKYVEMVDSKIGYFMDEIYYHKMHFRNMHRLNMEHFGYNKFWAGWFLGEYLIERLFNGEIKDYYK